jgi:hypothetical protein
MYCYILPEPKAELDHDLHYSKNAMYLLVLSVMIFGSLPWRIPLIRQ